MKRLISVVVLIVCALTIKAQYLIEQTEKERIRKNNVSQKVEWEHSVKNGVVSGKGSKASVTKYDGNGNVIEKISYKFNGDISSKVNYRYDSKNNIIEYTRFDGRQNAYTIKQYSKYDSKGNKIAETGMNGNAGQYSNYYKYDQQGNLIEINYFSNNELTEKRKIKYFNNKREIIIYKNGTVQGGKIVKLVDKNDNTLEETYFDESGQETRKHTYKYNAKGFLTEEAKFYGGNLREKIISKYNTEGHLIEVVYVRPDGTEYTNNKYIYDGSGRLVEERWYSENKDEFSRKKYLYNTQGDVIQADCYFAQFGSNYVYKYNYD